MDNSNLKHNLCRTCLVKISHNKINIFNTLDLVKKLIICSGLPVEVSDEYPENVCLQCYEQISLYYDFQQMCCKSSDTFNEILKCKEMETENIGKKNVKGKNSVLDTVKKDYRLQPEDNMRNWNNLLEKKKMGRPYQKIFRDQKVKKKTVIKRPNKSTTGKTVGSTPLNHETTEDLKEYLQFGKESEVTVQIDSSSSSKDHIYTNLETENYNISNEDTYNSQDKFLTDTENCSILQTRKHQCDRCSKSFNAIHRFEAHLRQHDGLPPYKCNMEGCERSFNRWYFYNKHREEHNLRQEQSFKCDIETCKRVYKNKSALNIHKRKFHNFGPELKKHMCEICGKVFKSSAVLNDHRYTHIDKTELPYACEVESCGKRFSNKEKLKVHKMRHAGIKNFICPYCGMRKTTRNELKIHINYHTLERTWPCNFCPKVCNSAGNLKMHVKNIHERAKDFACRYCERTFAKADTKKYHEMTHTGEKPNECKDCGRKFVQPAALRTHRKIHLRKSESAIGAITTEEIPNAGEDDCDEANLTTESLVAEFLSDTGENLD